jgi:hypothetical protein
MAKPLLLQTTKSGVEICSGKPRLIIIGNWYQVDEETGFVSQKSIDGVLKILAGKLVDMKFTAAKTEEQNVMILGDTIIITQSPRSSGNKLSPANAEITARAILEQYFKFATANGYFDEVDPNKLTENVEEPAKDPEFELEEKPTIQ